MLPDAFLQLALLIFALIIFYTLITLPRQALSSFRSKGRDQTQAHRFFIQGAQHLSKARSPLSSKSTSLTFAKSAVAEADKALSINPKDPALYILKALALDLMGNKTAAVKALDVALSPNVGKRLSGREKADALIKRGELNLGFNRRRRVEAAVADLVEAVGLCEEGGSKAKACFLLGKCYESKGMKEEAERAFEEARKIQDELGPAREGLNKM